LLALKGANSVAPPRGLGVLPPLQIKNAHQRRSDLGRYETTAPKSAPKTVTTSFAANLLTGLVGFMPILFTFAARVYLFLLAFICPLRR